MLIPNLVLTPSLQDRLALCGDERPLEVFQVGPDVRVAALLRPAEELDVLEVVDEVRPRRETGNPPLGSLVRAWGTGEEAKEAVVGRYEGPITVDVSVGGGEIVQFPRHLVQGSKPLRALSVEFLHSTCPPPPTTLKELKAACASLVGLAAVKQGAEVRVGAGEMSLWVRPGTGGLWEAAWKAAKRDVGPSEWCYLDWFEVLHEVWVAHERGQRWLEEREGTVTRKEVLDKGHPIGMAVLHCLHTVSPEEQKQMLQFLRPDGEGFATAILEINGVRLNATKFVAHLLGARRDHVRREAMRLLEQTFGREVDEVRARLDDLRKTFLGEAARRLGMSYDERDGD